MFVPNRVVASALRDDDLVSRLMKLPLNARNRGENRVTEPEIMRLCQRTRDMLLGESTLLHLQAPISICGDIHGQFADLVKVFDINGMPNNVKYLFLGDYVDRGSKSVETMCLLMAYKVKYPDNVYLLRGNHESEKLNRVYGFYEECKRKFSARIFLSFQSVFDCLPLAAVVSEQIFCCHGGLSPELKFVSEISEIERPANVPKKGIMRDLLWADPSKAIDHFAPNVERGVSVVFGVASIAEFLDVNDLELIVRAHQVVQNGYEFFGKRRLITLFTAADYCGEFENNGAILNVDEDLQCSFKVLPSMRRKKGFFYKRVARKDYALNCPDSEVTTAIESSNGGESVELAESM